MLCIMDRWAVSKPSTTHEMMWDTQHKKANAKASVQFLSEQKSLLVYYLFAGVFCKWVVSCQSEPVHIEEPHDRGAYKSQLSKCNFLKIRSDKSCLWRGSNSRKKREQKGGKKNVCLSFLFSFSLNKKLRRGRGKGRGKTELEQNYFRFFYGWQSLLFTYETRLDKALKIHSISLGTIL